MKNQLLTEPKVLQDAELLPQDIETHVMQITEPKLTQNTVPEYQGAEQSLHDAPFQHQVTEPEQNIKRFDMASQVTSYILHPFFLPTIAVTIFLFGNSIMTNVPLGVKLFLLGIVVLNTLIIPILSIFVMSRLNIITNLSLQYSSDRIMPMAIVAISYLICSYMLSNILMAFMIQRFLLAALASVMLALIITFFWKISLHMTAMGGFMAILLVVTFSGFGHFAYVILLFTLLAGVLASARLQLGRHNPAQVVVGFLSGFIVSGTTLLFL